MSTLKPPTPEEIHAWGWETGVEAGRSLADQSDAFIGITVQTGDTSDALQIYGRAFLRAFVRGYRAELARLLLAREDVVANQGQRAPSK